jgi:hypothetical protein
MTPGPRRPGDTSGSGSIWKTCRVVLSIRSRTRRCVRSCDPVIDVLEPLAAGEMPEDILEEYPYLEPDDIAASLLYAARQLGHPILAA